MTKTDKRYVALLADAAGSRALPADRRATLQAALRDATHALNRRWKPVIAARFALTRGDELEGLLTSPGAVWDIVHALRAAFPDVDWVVACGAGTLSTALAPTAPEVDGPCFHAARAALDAAKQHRRVLAFGGFARDAELDGLAAYYSALYWTWTGRQRRLALALRAPPTALTGTPTGKRQLPTPSAQSHMRRRMAWPMVEAGDGILRTLLAAL
jgi:hypothetical protein